MNHPLRDREEAGELLADKLEHLTYDTYRNAMVLAVPRGGVPVGFAIARKLNLALDILPVRPIPMPGEPDRLLGAVALDGVHYIQHDEVVRHGISEDAVARYVEEAEIELNREVPVFRTEQPALDIKGQPVILVDDGLASAAAMQAALLFLHEQHAGPVTIAAPVCSRAAFDELQDAGVEVICSSVPEPFETVGAYYLDFDQVMDDEVQQYLERSAPDIAEAIQ